MTKARTLADNFAADINAVTADAPLTGGGTSGTVTVGIQAGTTAQSGAVQLTDSTASTSITTAATPNSVKSAYDLANTANSAASSAQTTANAAIAKSTIDAKGDLLVGTANDTVSRLAVASTAGYVLTVDSAEATGLKWAAASSGAYTLLSTTAISGSTVSVSNISGNYTELIIVVTDFKASSDNSQPTFRFNNDSGNNYAAYSVINAVSFSGNVSGVDKVWFAGQTGGGAGLDNASDDGIAVMRIFRYAATDAFKTGQMIITYPQNDGYWYAVNTGFAYKSTSAINRFDLSCSGGWASQGNIYIYGAN